MLSVDLPRVKLTVVITPSICSIYCKLICSWKDIAFYVLSLQVEISLSLFKSLC